MEFFADCVRRFGSEPALLFEPHFDNSSNSSSSSSGSGSGSGSAEEADDGGTQYVEYFTKGKGYNNSSISSSTSFSSCLYTPNLLPGWWGYTWSAYWNECCCFSKSLLLLHAPRRCRVAIMGVNSPCWAIAFFGSIFCEGIAVGVYTTNNVDACDYVINHSQCFIAVVDTLENAKKMIAVRERQLQQQQQQQQQPPLLPGGSRVLQQIVVYRDRVPSAWKDLYKGVVIDYHTFIGMGEKVKERDLSNAIERQKPGCCCCIVYTSGTTGKPKGVMLSHDNITWTASLMAQIVSLSNKDRIISFLPLSHIAAQVVDLVAPLIMGSTVYFARPDALRGTLLYTLLRVKPTWFLGVPRVWEKIEQRLKEVGSRSSSIRRHLAAAAKDIGFKGATALLKGEKPSLLFHPVNKLLLQQVRKAIGFDCCTAWGSCAAPIDPETQKYFLSLGMPINSLYGLSESTGPQTFVAPSPGW